jgi:hypothetical protein
MPRFRFLAVPDEHVCLPDDPVTPGMRILHESGSDHANRSPCFPCAAARIQTICVWFRIAQSMEYDSELIRPNSRNPYPGVDVQRQSSHLIVA